MKVWITKYALTTGIFEVEVHTSDHSPGMVVADRNTWHEHYHGEGREWHRTWEDAVVRALEMRDAKVKSLRKKLAKLERMEFVQPSSSGGET